MNKHYLTVLTFLFILGLAYACRGGVNGSGEEATPTASPEGQPLNEETFIGLPNPASFYCQEMGYSLEMVEEEEGTVGICTFPDGTQCEEWDFLSGRCGQEYSFCERQGYQLETDGDIAQCVFPDGSSCPEYEFFTRKCQPPTNQ